MFTKATSNGYERNFSDLVFDFNDSFIQTFARNCLFDLIEKVFGRRIPAINTYFCAASIMSKNVCGAFTLFSFQSDKLYMHVYELFYDIYSFEDIRYYGYIVFYIKRMRIVFCTK